MTRASEAKQARLLERVRKAHEAIPLARRRRVEAVLAARDAGVTQRALAEVMGISITAVKKIEDHRPLLPSNNGQQ